MNSVVGLTPQTAMTLLPDTEAQRQKLRRSAFCLIACGVVGFIGAFATYWLGYILAVLYFVAAGITVRHTSTAREVLSNACCFQPNSAFASLRSFFILNAICTAVGIIFAIAGIVFHARESEAIDVFFAVLALIACLVGLPMSLYASKQCRRIHAAVDLVHNKTQIVAAAATTVVHIPVGGSTNNSDNNQIVMGTAVTGPNNSNATNNAAAAPGVAPYGDEEMQAAAAPPQVYGNYTPQPYALGYTYAPTTTTTAPAAATAGGAAQQQQPVKQASHEV